MFLGLAITAGIAGWFATQNNMTAYFEERPGAFWALVVLQLVLVFGLAGFVNRLSASAATLVFCLYAALNGLTFAVVLEIYTTASIVGAFGGAAALFAGMAAYGYVTKRDLSSWGGILFGALIALIVVAVIHMFTGGETLNLIIGFAGVIIFSALTAYDMNKIKQYAPVAGDEDSARKMAILGALSLYLDFINLFFSLLRLFGVNVGRD